MTIKVSLGMVLVQIECFFCTLLFCPCGQFVSIKPIFASRYKYLYDIQEAPERKNTYMINDPIMLCK